MTTLVEQQAREYWNALGSCSTSFTKWFPTLARYSITESAKWTWRKSLAVYCSRRAVVQIHHCSKYFAPELVRDGPMMEDCAHAIENGPVETLGYAVELWRVWGRDLTKALRPMR